MEDLKKLAENITDTMKDENLQDILGEITDATLETVFDEDFLKEIPIIRTILGLRRTSLSIQDKLFTKKLLSFLKGSENSTTEERRTQIEKIDSDPKYKNKVGEKLLFIIDKSEDIEKAGIIGILFNEFIKGGISYDDFLEVTSGIQQLTIHDIKWMVTLENWVSVDIKGAANFVSSPFFDLNLFTLDGAIGVSGTRLEMNMSKLGRKIQQILKGKI